MESHFLNPLMGTKRLRSNLGNFYLWVKYFGEKRILANLGLLKKIWRVIKLRWKGKVEGEEKGIKVGERETPLPSPTSKIYLKALTLHSPEEMEKIKDEIRAGNILIVRIEPLVKKSVEDARRVINEMSEFIASMGGDIARLGEERIILTPPSVQIWREKSSDSSNKI